MSILRKMLVVFLAGLLPFFLFSLAIDAGIIKTAGSSAPIKKILADSGIYNTLISGALDQAKTSGGDQGGGVSLTDTAVKQAAENTFTPQFLQQNTEEFLDSIFVWLNGKTPVPDFQIDVTSLKATFAAEAAKVAETKAATLPVCPTGLSGGADSFDVFSATCLPRGLTPAAVATQVQSGIASGEGFIKDPAISADTLKASGSDQSIFADQLKDAPMAYQRIKKTPFILGILALLTTLGIVFLSPSRIRGLRRAGIVFLVVGFVLLAFAWALNWGINQKALPKLSLDNKVLQEKIRTLVSDITANIDKTYYIFGGAYAALGALAIAEPMFMHKRRSLSAGRQGEHLQPEQPAHHEAHNVDTPTAKPHQKKPPKIQ
ncbi:MAG: hypothetical protein AAB541_04025 [Patescibacteria group bacterium]